MSKKDWSSVFLNIIINILALVRTGHKITIHGLSFINITDVDFQLELIIIIFTSILMIHFCKKYKNNKRFVIPKLFAWFTAVIDVVVLFISSLIANSICLVSQDTTIIFSEKCEFINKFIATHFVFLDISNCIVLYIFGCIFMCLANVFKAIAVSNEE